MLLQVVLLILRSWILINYFALSFRFSLQEVWDTSVQKMTQLQTNVWWVSLPTWKYLFLVLYIVHWMCTFYLLKLCYMDNQLSCLILLAPWLNQKQIGPINTFLLECTVWLHRRMPKFWWRGRNMAIVFIYLNYLLLHVVINLSIKTVIPCIISLPLFCLIVDFNFFVC